MDECRFLGKSESTNGFPLCISMKFKSDFTGNGHLKQDVDMTDVSAWAQLDVCSKILKELIEDLNFY